MHKNPTKTMDESDESFEFPVVDKTNNEVKFSNEDDVEAPSNTRNPSLPQLESNNPNNPNMKKQPSRHTLRTVEPGKSAVEQLARRIEDRRQNRIPITMSVRIKYLRYFHDLAVQKQYPPNKIPLPELRSFRNKVAEEQYFISDRLPDVMKQIWLRLGFRDTKAKLLEVLDRAITVVEEERKLTEHDYFHYKDFNFYYTVVESSWPWMRNRLSVSLVTIALFYALTPILFCNILKDEGVCQPDPTPKNRLFYGGLSAVYFASTTMSTVGYGDLSVEKDEWWLLLIGAIYMVVAVSVATTALDAGINSAFGFEKLSEFQNKLYTKLAGEFQDGELLYMRIRRIKHVKLLGILTQFLMLNMLGVFVSRFFVYGNDDDTQNWSWMTSIYWAVQTTTTVGYGDLNMPYGLRSWQICYLIISTYFVGTALGRLGNLKKEIKDLRRRYAWKRREVCKGMILEMKAQDSDDKIDQYEFVVASLLTLNKISSQDIEPIMVKFRQHAKGKGYISLDQMDKSEPIVTENDAKSHSANFLRSSMRLSLFPNPFLPNRVDELMNLPGDEDD